MRAIVRAGLTTHSHVAEHVGLRLRGGHGGRPREVMFAGFLLAMFGFFSCGMFVSQVMAIERNMRDRPHLRCWHSCVWFTH